MFQVVLVTLLGERVPDLPLTSLISDNYPGVITVLAASTHTSWQLEDVACRSPMSPTETYELAQNATGGTTVRCTIDVHPAGAGRIAAPLLALLHPLLAWEASWLDNARDIL